MVTHDIIKMTLNISHPNLILKNKMEFLDGVINIIKVSKQYTPQKNIIHNTTKETLYQNNFIDIIDPAYNLCYTLPSTTCHNYQM